MSARVLVVDDVPVNVRLLEAKLTAEYYHVIAAANGTQALDKVKTERPDIVLLDVMMPGMDGFEVCRRIRAMPESANLPVVMVTALSEQHDRVQGLEAGADDFLTKPIQDEALFSRIRSLLRLKMVLDELRLREETSRALGVVTESFRIPNEHLLDGFKVAVVTDDPDDAADVCAVLPAETVSRAIGTERDGAIIQRLVDEAPDLVIVDLHLRSDDALRFAAELRSTDATRFCAILLLADSSDQKRLAKALELGVNDYVMKPVDPSELTARVRTQARHQRYREQLRGAFSESVNQAHTDPLTGLFNRRYMIRHIENLRQARHSDTEPIAALMVDIDHFKSVNDTYGHDVGDKVLQAVANQMRGRLRPGDVLSRHGGEEFLVVLPAADRALACSVAERLRQSIADMSIPLPNGAAPLRVTVSIGLTLDLGKALSVDDVIKRADEALYQAKREGRNRVVVVDSVPAAA